jgi:hypothetical protein
MIFAAAYTTVVWAQLNFTAADWVKVNTSFKLELLRAVIEEARKNNVTIRFSPEYYVKEIDFTIENAIRNQDKVGLATSVGIMLHTIAAMEGDWDNGENKLEHAKKWLGEYFEEFKKTYPQKYARLLNSTREGGVWKHFGYTQNERLSYDPATISYSPGDIVQIWIKREYTDREAGLKDLRTRGSYNPAYNDYSHTLNLYRIDCTKNTFAILTTYTYKQDGSLIEAFDHPERIVAISSASVVDVLSRTACAAFKKQAG